MTEQIDMSLFIAASSAQINAEDLLDGPRTITITKVTASPDSKEQPVNISFEGDGGKMFRPCKTVRRIMVGVWGKDAAKYIGRSMTLYRDPTVSFGGMQVGGIRVSHMSDIQEEKTIALLVTRGRKAPFKIKPLLSAPSSQTQDFTAQLAELREIAQPGNMDALGAKWQEIGADARKALAAELPALKAACEETEGVGLAPVEKTPAEELVEKIIAQADAAKTPAALEKIVADAEGHKAAMPDELQMKLEVAFNRNQRRLEPAEEGVK